MSLERTAGIKISDTFIGISDFKKGYRSRTNIVKDENSDLLADSNSILNRLNNYFCQLLNLHGVHDVMQTEYHTTETLKPEPIIIEAEISIEKLRRYKSPVTVQTPAEMVHAGGNTLRSEVHKLINFIWNKKEVPQHRKDFVIVPIYIKGDETDCSNYRGISLLATTYILSNILVPRLTPYVE
jgi:hypothetical protein